MHKKGLVALIVVVVVTVSGILLAATAHKGSGDGMVCKSTGQNRTVVIRNAKMNPSNTIGKYCDTLTIKNEDGVTREIGFGPHDHHISYDGVSERLLAKGESFTVTLSQRGSFHYHDHFHEETAGTFTVK
jgi:plastocyanin